jgi:sporulation protein YlmC with PRC-barrel domain
MEMVSLLGKEVVELNGSVIGIVKNVLFDDNAWEVTSLDVELNEKTADELDAKKLFRNFRIPLGVNLVQGIGDTILLRTPKDELTAILASQNV